MMKFPLISVGAAILLGLNAPAGAQSAVTAAAVPPSPQPGFRGSPGQELLRVTNEMWFLLSGVVDRKGADSSAPRFQALIDEMDAVGKMLQGEDSMAQDLEALDMMHYRIAEALEDLSSEFESLCRVNCYGSPSLIKAFRRAVESGIVGEEIVEDLKEPRPQLTDREARQEISRFRRLVEPDLALLQALQSVQDVETANRAIASLKSLASRLEGLQPKKEFADRSFGPAALRSAREAYAPVEPLLWAIRSELVRIVSLPGYDEAPFDKFSDTLDRVYECLGNSHSTWFEDVFDASFRSDLDDALHENATTSN